MASEANRKIIRAAYTKATGNKTTLNDAQIDVILESVGSKTKSSEVVTRMLEREASLLADRQPEVDPLEGGSITVGSQRVADIVAVLNDSVELRNLAIEAGVNALRAKIIALDTADVLATVLTTEQINAMPDLNTCDADVPNDSGRLTVANNPEWVMVAGSGTKDRRSSYYQEWYASSDDGLPLVSELERLERAQKVSKDIGRENRMKAIKLMLSKGANNLRYGVGYLKQRALIGDLLPNVMVGEEREEEDREGRSTGQWCALPSPIYLQPKGNTRMHKSMGYLQFLQLDVHKAYADKVKNPKKSEYNCLIDTLGREPDQTKGVAVTTANAIAVFHSFNALLADKASAKYLERLLTDETHGQEAIEAILKFDQLWSPLSTLADTLHRAQTAAAREQAKKEAANAAA